MCATITHVNARRFHGNTPRPRAPLHTTTLPHDFFAIRRLFPTPTRGIKKNHPINERMRPRGRENFTQTLSLSRARSKSKVRCTCCVIPSSSLLHLTTSTTTSPPQQNEREAAIVLFCGTRAVWQFSLSHARCYAASVAASLGSAFYSVLSLSLALWCGGRVTLALSSSCLLLNNNRRRKKKHVQPHRAPVQYRAISSSTSPMYSSPPLPSAMQRMQVRKQNGKEENVLRRDRHIHTQTHATYDDLHLPRVDWLAGWLALAV